MDTAKTILLTGAGGGVGLGLIRSFLEHGAERIYACDIDTGSINDLETDEASRVVVHKLDVTDEAAIAAAAEQFQDVEILVNCHGVVVHKGIVENDNVDAFRREMDINYWGQVLMCRAFAPIVGKNGGGAIVNFLSPLAYVTHPFCASYCASKAACRVLTEAIRAELAAQGTFVMAVYPGAIDTPMMANLDIEKNSPTVVADTVLAGLRDETEEIWPGPDAEDMRQRFVADPDAVTREASAFLRV